MPNMMLQKEQLRQKFRSFMKKYGNEYTRLINPCSLPCDDDVSVEQFLYDYYQDAYYKPWPGANVFFQIFSAIDAYPPEINPYYQMMLEIEREYGLDRDIVEVGAGMFPALSHEIAKRQSEIGKGSITAFDPSSVVRTLDGVTIVREPFTASTPIKCDLLIARSPVGGTAPLLDTAAKNGIEFYLKICGYTSGRTEWQDYIEDRVVPTLPDDFVFSRETTIDPLRGGKDTVYKTLKKVR